jgi:hypothetical protein
MNTKLHSKGTTIISKREKRLVIYGDIVEGTVKKGMYVLIPINSSFSLRIEIESVEYMDKIKEKESYIALVLKPEENVEEELELIQCLNIGDEVLEIGDAE